MNSESRRIAAVAALATLAMATAFAVLLPRPEMGPPEEIQRPIAVSLLLAIPGLLGLIGAARGARSVLAAAGVLCVLQSFASFAGVTLVFLLPGLLLLVTGSEPNETARTVEWRPARLVFVLLLGIPAAVAFVQVAGIIAIVPLVVVAGLARARSAEPGERPRLSRSGAMLGVALIALGVGAWVALLGVTEERCWIARESPAGLVYERAPGSHESLILGGPDGAVAYGCGSGELTPTGFGLAAVLAIGGVALAATVPRSLGAEPRPGRCAG